MTDPATGPATPRTTENPSPEDQRDALEDSEQAAAVPRPESYKEEATDRKVVEIGGDKTDAPIKGLDPD